jgi:hypothetical protein
MALSQGPQQVEQSIYQAADGLTNGQHCSNSGEVFTGSDEAVSFAHGVDLLLAFTGRQLRITTSSVSSCGFSARVTIPAPSRGASRLYWLSEAGRPQRSMTKQHYAHLARRVGLQ